MKLPNILFTNVNFRNDDSCGITVSKLFDFFPREKLFAICDSTFYPNISICSTFFCVKNNKTFTEISNATYQQSGIPHKRNLSFLRSVFRFVIGYKKYKEIELHPKLIDWITSLSLDFIFVNPDTSANIDFALKIANLTKAKIIIHILDDKFNGHYPGSFGKYYRYVFRKKLKKIILEASVRLCISELMKKEYQARFGMDFFVFNNSINLYDFSVTYNVNKIPEGTIKVVYMGVLDYNLQTILKFAEALNCLKKEGHNIIFEIYTKKIMDDTIYRALKKYSTTNILDFISQEKIPIVLSTASFLLLPLPFEKKYNFFRLSLPTKTAEYLASGIPIIVMAPHNSALVNYASENNWGYLITDNNVVNVCAQIKKLLSMENNLFKLVQNGLHLARINHDKKNQQNHLYKILDAYL